MVSRKKDFKEHCAKSYQVVLGTKSVWYLPNRRRDVPLPPAISFDLTQVDLAATCKC